MALAGCSTADTGLTRNATVTDVVDGDTVDIRFPDGSTDTVRLLGVDTPETHGPVHPGEFPGVDNATCLDRYADRATQYTAQLDGRTVTVVFDPVAGRRGAYDRLLAYIRVDGTDHSRRLLQRGLARAYTDATYTGKAAFTAMEADARMDEVGLWTC